MHSLSIKLDPNSDLKQSIEKLAKKIQSHGFILGVVGNLSKAVFQCPGRAQPTILEGNLEIITLNGTISPKGSHLHLSLSDGDCQVWGGHLENGTLILKGADILIGILDTDSYLSSFSPIDIDNKVLEPRIEIAVINDCTWSKRALRILLSMDIPHSVNLIESDIQFKQLFNRSNLSTFPQIFIDGNLIGGYQEFSKLVDEGKLNEFR